MNLCKALAAVKAGKTVTRAHTDWKRLRWTPEGLVNITQKKDKNPTGICLMHDDVFAHDWKVVE